MKASSSRLLSTFLMLMVITLCLPKKAKAGGIIMLSSTPQTFVFIIGGVLAGAGALATIPVGLSPRMPERGNPLRIAANVGLLLILLDDKADKNLEHVKLQFQARYPMISDSTVFEELADMLDNEITQLNLLSLKKGEHYSINLNESDVRDVLSRLDHTGIESDIEKLVEDLI